MSEDDEHHHGVDHHGGHSALTSFEIDIIVKKSVRNALETLGIDLHDSKALRHLQADFAYMRRQRLGAENIAEWIKKTAITAIIGGVLFTIWQGIKIALSAKGMVP